MQLEDVIISTIFVLRGFDRHKTRFIFTRVHFLIIFTGIFTPGKDLDSHDVCFRSDPVPAGGDPGRMGTMEEIDNFTFHAGHRCIYT